MRNSNSNGQAADDSSWFDRGDSDNEDDNLAPLPQKLTPKAQAPDTIKPISAARAFAQSSGTSKKLKISKSGHVGVKSEHAGIASVGGGMSPRTKVNKKHKKKLKSLTKVRWCYNDYCAWKTMCRILYICFP